MCRITSDTMRERVLREVDITLKKQLKFALQWKLLKLKLSKCMRRITTHNESKRVDAVKRKQTRKKMEKGK